MIFYNYSACEKQLIDIDFYKTLKSDDYLMRN